MPTFLRAQESRSAAGANSRLASRGGQPSPMRSATSAYTNGVSHSKPDARCRDATGRDVGMQCQLPTRSGLCLRRPRAPEAAVQREGERPPKAVRSNGKLKLMPHPPAARPPVPIDREPIGATRATLVAGRQVQKAMDLIQRCGTCTRSWRQIHWGIQSRRGIASRDHLRRESPRALVLPPSRSGAAKLLRNFAVGQRARAVP